MPLYVISYDEHPSRNYEECHQLMFKWQARRLLESVWLAELAGPAEAVRRILQAAFRGSGSIAVLELLPNADWSIEARKEGMEWLHAHMNS